MVTKISQLPATQTIGWVGRSILSTPADGVLLSSNAAGTAFVGWKFGAATGSVPYLKVSGSGLQMRNATDDSFTNFTANTTRTPGNTLSGLGSASGAGSGTRAWVTDAIQTFTAVNFGTAVTGGGANGVPVVSDGTNWIIG